MLGRTVFGMGSRDGTLLLELLAHFHQLLRDFRALHPTVQLDPLREPAVLRHLPTASGDACADAVGKFLLQALEQPQPPQAPPQQPPQQPAQAQPQPLARGQAPGWLAQASSTRRCPWIHSASRRSCGNGNGALEFHLRGVAGILQGNDGYDLRRRGLGQ